MILLVSRKLGELLRLLMEGDRLLEDEDRDRDRLLGDEDRDLDRDLQLPLAGGREQ